MASQTPLSPYQQMWVGLTRLPLPAPHPDWPNCGRYTGVTVPDIQPFIDSRGNFDLTKYLDLPSPQKKAESILKSIEKDSPQLRRQFSRRYSLEHDQSNDCLEFEDITDHGESTGPVVEASPYSISSSKVSDGNKETKSDCSKRPTRTKKSKAKPNKDAPPVEPPLKKNKSTADSANPQAPLRRSSRKRKPPRRFGPYL
ncbi:hypothetical protein P9112_012331 [Eukaryota sp. TZLM1-RC]